SCLTLQAFDGARIRGKIRRQEFQRDRIVRAVNRVPDRPHPCLQRPTARRWSTVRGECRKPGPWETAIIPIPGWRLAGRAERRRPARHRDTEKTLKCFL